MLLLANGRTLNVDDLALRVWDDAMPPKPVASLRAYVANLRRVLDVDGRLLTDGDGYRLDTAADRVDSRDFERRVQSGRALLADGDTPAAERALVQALDMWRGAPLADFRDQRFAHHEVHRLEMVRADAVDARFDAALRQRRNADLVAGLEREIAQNPMREQLWRMLMIALYRAGRRTDALSAYTRLEGVLDRELGVTPSDALERLAGDIRSESPDLDWRPDTSNPVRAGSPRRSPALYGRSNESRRLREAMAAAAERRGSVAVLLGDSGMGKTSLASGLVDEADDLGMATAWVGHAGETPRPPGSTWSQMLRDLARHVGTEPGTATPLPDWWRQAAEGGDEEFASPSGFDAVDATVTAVTRLVERQPALIVLDDLQRADRFTHHVLEALGSSIHRTPLMIVATWQGAGPHAARARGVQRLMNRADVLSMTLRGIDVDATAALIGSMCETEPTAQFVADVHGHTGGNPFYVVELTRWLVETGRIRDGAATLDIADVPEAVSGVIRRRLSDMPSATRQALILASVAGPEFAANRLAMAQSVDAGAMVTRLGAARRAGLIDESADQSGWFRFRHGLVRDAVGAQLTATQRAEAHAQLANAYAAEADPVASQDAMDGSSHAWRAGVELDPSTALVLLDRARADAWSRSGYRDVAELDRRALDVCSRLPDDTTRHDREVDLQMQLASVEAVIGGQSSAKALEGLRRSAAQGPDVVQSTTAVAMGCLQACGTGRYYDAETLSDSLVEFFGATGDPIAGAAGFYIRALMLFMRGHLDASLRAAATLADAVPPIDFATYGALASFQVLIYAVEAHAWGLQQESGRASRALESGIALGVDRADAFGTAVVRMAEIQLAAMTGDWEGLAPRAATMADELTRLGIDQFVGGAQVIGGWARAMGEGGVDTTDEVCDALALHCQGGRRIFAPLYYGLLADVTASHRDDVEAMKLLTAAESMAASTGEHVWDAQLSVRRLRLAARVRSTNAL